MNNECEQFGELISGLIDGELSGTEMSRVNAHLVNCRSCQETKAEFEMVDRALQFPPPGTGDPSCHLDHQTSPSLRKPSISRSPKPNSANRLHRKLWMPVAFTTAAILLVGVTIFWPTSDVGAQTPEVSIPTFELDELKDLNRNTERTVHSTLKTMELQLRLMRVEANRLDSNDSAEDTLKSQIQTEIERMLLVISQLESKSN